MPLVCSCTHCEKYSIAPLSKHAESRRRMVRHQRQWRIGQSSIDRHHNHWQCIGSKFVGWIAGEHDHRGRYIDDAVHIARVGNVQFGCGAVHHWHGAGVWTVCEENYETIAGQTGGCDENWRRTTEQCEDSEIVLQGRRWESIVHFRTGEGTGIGIQRHFCSRIFLRIGKEWRSNLHWFHGDWYWSSLFVG